MKKLSHLIELFLLTGFISGCATSDPPYPGSSERLIGRWKSNKELSSEFNSKQAQLTEDQINFLDQMFGRMEIEYREDGTVEIFIPAHELNLMGKQVSMEESRSSEPVNIIGFDDDTVVFEMEVDYLGKQISIINFENENTYWVYMSNGITTLHAREYFSRIIDGGDNE